MGLLTNTTLLQLLSSVGENHPLAIAHFLFSLDGLESRDARARM